MPPELAPAPAAVAAPRPRPGLGLAWLASFAGLAAVVLLNESPTGDLSRWYTDHLHHAYATWVALHRGLAIYAQPFGEAARGVAYPHAVTTWDFMPGMVYPPGVFAVFLPVALVGQWVPLAPVAWAKLGVLYTLALAHGALWAVGRAVRATARAGEWVLLFVAWLYLARMGVQGFFDGAYLLAGGLMVVALARGEPERALQWFAGAALLHYRAAVLVPLAACAAWQVVRGRPWRAWPWRTLALVGAACALAVWTFALTLPVTSGFREAQVSLLRAGGPRLWVVAGATLLAALAAWRWADGWVAATAVAGGVLAVIYVNYWWHGAVLLFAPLAVGATGARAPERLPWARAALLAWLLVLQPLAWRDAPTALLTELTDHFRLAR